MKPNILRSIGIGFAVVFRAIFKNIWIEEKFNVWEKIFLFVVLVLFWWVAVPWVAIGDFKSDMKRYTPRVENVSKGEK